MKKKIFHLIYISIKNSKRINKTLMRSYLHKTILSFSFLVVILLLCITLSNISFSSPILESQENSYTKSKRRLENSSSEAQKYYDAKIHTVKLFGSFELGYYYVNLFIGTPPQKQTVIVDTGSSLTAIPCSGHKKKNSFYINFNVVDCQSSSCGSHIDPHFNSGASSSFHSIDCTNYVGNFQCRSCDQNNKRCSFGIV